MADQETSVPTASPPAAAGTETAAVAGAAPAAETASPPDGETAAATEAAAAEAVDENVAGAILDEIRDLDSGAEAGVPGLTAPFADEPAEPFQFAPQVSDELRRILRISVPVIVKLADKQLPLGDIIDLSPGSIVEFTRSADTPLELLVNNKVIGSGVAVKVGEKFGLRIDEICSIQETIRKLGE